MGPKIEKEGVMKTQDQTDKEMQKLAGSRRLRVFLLMFLPVALVVFLFLGFFGSGADGPILVGWAERDCRIFAAGGYCIRGPAEYTVMQKDDASVRLHLFRGELIFETTEAFSFTVQTNRSVYAAVAASARLTVDGEQELLEVLVGELTASVGLGGGQVRQLAVGAGRKLVVTERDRDGEPVLLGAEERVSLETITPLLLRLTGLSLLDKTPVRIQLKNGEELLGFPFVDENNQSYFRVQGGEVIRISVDEFRELGREGP